MMDPLRPGPLLLLALSGLLGGPAPSAAGSCGDGDPDEPWAPRPGAARADVFHPAPGEAKPRKGGEVTIHLSTDVQHLNTLLTGNSWSRRLGHELHERLIQRDWESWEHRGVLAERFRVRDSAWQGEGEGRRRLVGTIDRAEGLFRVKGGEPLPLESLELLPATVFDLDLRRGVRWHDGHPFDAEDVLFSYSLLQNPEARCEHVRYQFEGMEVERLSEWSLRFLRPEPYFLALDALTELTVLPRHLYDLRDPDHPAHDPEATDSAVAQHVNENPHNREWVGLGPYRLTRFGEKEIVAERFEDYFDPANGGYLDRLRWRILEEDTAVVPALHNGEIDFSLRISSEDYFGEATKVEAFTDRLYKGFLYAPNMSYVAWNLRRAPLDDARVRQALAHAFDWDEFIATVGSGLGRPVTASWYCFSPDYDEAVEPYPFDLERAEQLLAEAGWYDRDGDGLVDKEGEPFALALLLHTSYSTGQRIGQKLQENLARIGVELELEVRDTPTLVQRVRDRDFDAVFGSWTLNPVDDYYSLWHSSEADRPGSLNRPGVVDEEVDRLCEAIQRTLDDSQRQALFRELHRRLYAMQPYLFGYTVPYKFAMDLRVRGFQTFALDPGYAPRRWYLAESR